MNVRELSKDQLSELKQNYVCETVLAPSWGDLFEADNIPDEVIFEYYADIYFVNDDFFCTANL